jgi:hypothetical protein
MTTPSFERPAVRVLMGVYARSARVSVDDGSILVDGEVACERVDSVELDLRRIASVVVTAPKRMTFAFTDVADAQRMIQSLGRQWSRVRTTTAIRIPLLLVDLHWLVVLTSPVWLFLTISALWLSVQTAMFVFAMAASLVGGLGRGLARHKALRARLQATMDIGTDGVRLDWLWFVKRFFRFSEMERARHDEEGTVNLELRNGQRVSVQAVDMEQVDAVTARINEGIAALRMTPKATESPALREPVVGTSALVELRRLAAVGEGDYRIVGLDREQLWTILEDPASETIARANAAAALSGKLDDRERSRLRVAATATASPRVRVAIEKAASASSTDEELLEALEQVYAEGA